MLLNGHPKRNYDYSPPIIYPSENFEDLIESNLMNKLFSYFTDTHRKPQKSCAASSYLTDTHSKSQKPCTVSSF